MREGSLDTIAAKNVVGTGAAPGATLGVAVRTAEGWQHYSGAAGRFSIRDRTPVEPGTIYDLASVSKPLLAMLCAERVAKGRLDWDTKLSSLLIEMEGFAAGEASVEALLSHRGGLRAHVDLFRDHQAQQPINCRSMMRRAAAAMLPTSDAPMGTPPAVYSDLGYLLLGKALERLENERLDELLERFVTTPLGLEIRSSRLWLRQGLTPRAFAPTEQVSWRGGELVASTHDENAWAIAGHGFAGHAGLFGNVNALLTFGCRLCDAYNAPDPNWPASVFVRKMARAKPGTTQAIGFDTKAVQGASSTGDAFGPRTFGHLGFTGTSLWCDPDANIVVSLLTNRVNPRREPNPMREVRLNVHDQLFREGLLHRSPLIFPQTHG